jgi:hypothetical protein
MKRTRSTIRARSAAVVLIVLAASVFVAGGTANADPTPLGLGTATNFAIHAGDTVTNSVPATQITGDVGVPKPGSVAYGPPNLLCANMTAGSTAFSTDGALPVVGTCQGTDPGTILANDARTAFITGSAASPAMALGVTDLHLANGGTGILKAGIYSFGAAATNLATATTLTLDAQGSASATWIFKASSTLITDAASSVSIINAPAGSNLACNVFWTVGSSATLGASSTFVGTILASADITVNGPASGAATVVNGRLLAANQGSGAGQVTIPGLATIIRPAGCPIGAPGTGGGTTPITAVPATPVGSAPPFTG